MFERFTERARQVVVLAQDEARMLGHNYIGTEHMLLGVLREEGGGATRVLEQVGVSGHDARGLVRQIVGEGDEVWTGQVPFTPRAKRVLDLAYRESLNLRHDYVAPEHILLGLIVEEEGVARHVLDTLGADPVELRRGLLEVLEADPDTPAARSAPLGELSIGVRRSLRGMPRRISTYPPDTTSLARAIAGFLVAAAGFGFVVGYLVGHFS